MPIHPYARLPNRLSAQLPFTYLLICPCPRLSNSSAQSASQLRVPSGLCNQCLTDDVVDDRAGSSFLSSLLALAPDRAYKALRVLAGPVNVGYRREIVCNVAAGELGVDIQISVHVALPDLLAGCCVWVLDSRREECGTKSRRSAGHTGDTSRDHKTWDTLCLRL